MEQKPLKGRSLADLIASPLMPTVSWVEPGVVPKRAKILTGAEAKAGKTFCNLQMCKDIVTGANVYGHPEFKVVGTPRVVYLEREIAENQMQSRIQRMFHGLSPESLDRMGDLLWIASWDTQVRLDESTGIKRLRNYIETYQPNILILDPLSTMMLGEVNNLTVNRVYNICDALIDDYASLDLSIVITHHYGKTNSAAFNQKDSTADRLDPYNFRDASAFKDRPDGILTFTFDGKPAFKRYPHHRRPWKEWNLKARLTSRHSDGVPDFRLGVHHGGHLGVFYTGELPTEPSSPQEEECKPVTMADVKKAASTQGRLLI